ncbi:DNA fragmentation factor subunit alpha-like [Rhynchophorus ferrugineus]|uniref:DNA fragmentation factor subunit alpha-like n=1 Tax=Rhynchophorus ferrugineus TaxID=354439 RepID=UPI003FCC7FF7
MEADENQKTKPFKICNNSREIRKGIVAVTLEDLTSKVKEKLELMGDDHFMVVLEADGTEIDDEEYFATLEPNTSLMILANNQKWTPPYPRCELNKEDEVDDSRGHELAGLVGRLKSNLCHLSLLGGPELELLSDMDPESLADLTYPDKIFLDQLKEASGRFLCEKRQAQDAMDLLRLYQEKEATESEAN